MLSGCLDLISGTIDGLLDPSSLQTLHVWGVEGDGGCDNGKDDFKTVAIDLVLIDTVNRIANALIQDIECRWFWGIQFNRFVLVKPREMRRKSDRPRLM